MEWQDECFRYEEASLTHSSNRKEEDENPGKKVKQLVYHGGFINYRELNYHVLLSRMMSCCAKYPFINSF
jgi:hypothetical protein